MRAIIFAFVVLLLVACDSEPPKRGPMRPVADCETEAVAPRNYLFIGHGYQWYTKNRVDRRIELLDRSCYDQIWLGGDITSETTRDRSTLEYLDSLFDLGSEHTHWAVGNHDTRNGNVELISEFTGRPTHYMHYQNGITTVVLNTTLDETPGDSAALCAERQQQYELLINVLDTIQKSSHLVVLAHHVVWHDVHQWSWIFANRIKKDWRATCDPKATFFHSFWDKITDLPVYRDIRVWLVAGDAGFWGRKDNDRYRQHALYRDGVWMLACGINNSKYVRNPDSLALQNKDHVMVARHWPAQDSLGFEFLDLDSLLHAQYVHGLEE